MNKKRGHVLSKEFKTEVDKVLSKFKEDLYTLHDLATKDEKTQVYNHRFFMNIFELEFERAERKKQKLSLAVIDIDFFKKLNDTHGHLLGDKVLFELAQELQRTIRKYDVLSRFGGEEFFVLLPGASKSTAKLVAARLRKGILNNSFLKKYSVKISIGVTEYKSKDTIKRMIKRADDALYKAKRNGRDRVEVL